MTESVPLAAVFVYSIGIELSLQTNKYVYRLFGRSVSLSATCRKIQKLQCVASYATRHYSRRTHSQTISKRQIFCV